MKRINELRGVGRVYRFTLVQHFKNRANLISLILMLVLSMVTVPLATVMMGTAESPSGESHVADEESSALSDEMWEVTELYLLDESGYALAQRIDLPGSIAVHSLTAAMSDAEIETLAETALYMRLFYFADSGTYRIETHTKEGSTLQYHEIYNLSLCLTDALEEARLESFTEEEREWLTAIGHSYAEEGKADEVLGDRSEDVGAETSFAVEYAYAILLLMLSMMSSSFIIRAVVEEKSSKLIDLLMISVQPLALLCGKILAMMTVVFGTLLALAAGVGLSTAVSNVFWNTDVIGGGLESMGVSLAMLNLGWETAIIVLISLVLSYLMYAIMSGIAGASCSSMNDTEAAMMGVTFSVLFGYLVSCVTAAIPNRILATVTSLIPLVSSFCAPVHYVCGRIGLPILLLSWLIQVVVVLLLARTGAAVYRDLIMYQGKRVRLREMWNMVKKTRGGATCEK